MVSRQSIQDEIRGFVSRYRSEHGTETGWRPPLVGFATVKDPLFAALKRVVSPSHALPDDLLPGARTVIAYFVPFENAVGESNIDGQMASPQWVRAYMETNTLLEEVGACAKELIETAGESVVVPPPTHNFDSEKLISDWSHRHVAFIAGLGRFGLNNMLITKSGCCGRVGSLVTTLDVPADRRSEREACLNRHGVDCERCVYRCVGAALSKEMFDRHKCYAMCLRNAEKYRDQGLADVCGKCLVDVPCSSADPVSALTQSDPQSEKDK